MKFYHGTSYESGMNIIKSKSFGHIDTVWTCSDNDMTYCVSEEYDGSREAAIRTAVEAGQIAAAHINSKFTDIILFEFDTDDDTENFLPDVSCENTDYFYQIDNDILNDMIASGEVKMKIYRVRNAYEPYMRAFYVASLYSNRYYRFDDKRLEKACRCLQTADTCWFFDDYINSYNDPTETEITDKFEEI